VSPATKFTVIGGRALICRALAVIAILTGALADSAGAKQDKANAACHASRVRKSAHRHPTARCGKPHTRVRPATGGAGKGQAKTPPAGAQVPPSSGPTGGPATIAAVLEAPCQGTELRPEPANLALVRAAVLCLINRERAEHGIGPLKANRKLEAAAEGHSNELVSANYFAHVSPSGLTPVQRIAATGYIPSPEDGYVIGENLAWGTYELSTPEAVVKAWIASPEHLANILEAHYVDTGIGVTAAVPNSLANGAPGATYAEEFGVIVQ
jgi:uncharacterized protein YkwD